MSFVNRNNTFKNRPAAQGAGHVLPDTDRVNSASAGKESPIQQAADESERVQQQKRMQQIANASPQNARAASMQAMASSAAAWPRQIKPSLQTKDGGMLSAQGHIAGAGVLQAKGGLLPHDIPAPPPPSHAPGAAQAPAKQGEGKEERKGDADPTGPGAEAAFQAALTAYHALEEGGPGKLGPFGAQLGKLKEIIGLADGLIGSGAVIYNTFKAQAVAEEAAVRTQALGAAQEYNAAMRTGFLKHVIRAYGIIKKGAEEKKDTEEKKGTGSSLTHIDRITLNTLEWMLNAASPVKFCLVTPTGDSALRTQSGYAYFSKLIDIHSTATATYLKDDYTETTNVECIQAGTKAFQRGPSIILPCNVPDDFDGVMLTCIHELQHYADKHYGYDSQAAIRKQLDSTAFLGYQESLLDKLIRFKTEYRAHYYAGQLERLQNRPVRDRVNAILRNYPELQSRDSHVAGLFMQEAEKYAADIESDGFNNLNSIRINAFYDVLDSIGADPFGMRYPAYANLRREVKPIGSGKPTHETRSAAVAISTALAALRPEEARFISNSKPWQQKINTHLSGMLVKQVLGGLIGLAGSK